MHWPNEASNPSGSYRNKQRQYAFQQVVPTKYVQFWRYLPYSSKYQVSNRSSCIKIAVDFIDPSSVGRSAITSEEFRSENMRDVLQLKSVLWHGWSSVTKLLSSEHHDDSRARERKRCQNAKNRRSIAYRSNQDKRLEARKQARGAKIPPNIHGGGAVICPHIACNGRDRTHFVANIFQHLCVFLPVQSAIFAHLRSIL